MAARGVDDVLGALEVLLERTAQLLDVVVAVLHLRGIALLVQLLDSDLVVVGALLVLGLDFAHARSVDEEV